MGWRLTASPKGMRHPRNTSRSSPLHEPPAACFAAGMEGLATMPRSSRGSRPSALSGHLRERCCIPAWDRIGKGIIAHSHIPARSHSSDGFHLTG